MASCGFLQEIGVDVGSMESRFRQTSIGLPRLDRSRIRSSIGVVASHSTSSSVADMCRLRRSMSSSLNSSSRPGSGGGVRASKELQSVVHLPKASAAFDTGVWGRESKLRSFGRLGKGDVVVDDLAAVLFLDVDGVLHPYHIRHPRQQFAMANMMQLKEVMKSIPDAKIVLSTAWREDVESRNEITDRLKEYGLPSFVSTTPTIARLQRTKEILAWVKQHRPRTWVAVDDLPLLDENDEMRDHFVQTHQSFGMRPKDAEDIIRLFKKQRAQFDTRMD